MGTNVIKVYPKPKVLGGDHRGAAGANGDREGQPDFLVGKRKKKKIWLTKEKGKFPRFKRVVAQLEKRKERWRRSRLWFFGLVEQQSNNALTKKSPCAVVVAKGVRQHKKKKKKKKTAADTKRPGREVTFLRNEKKKKKATGQKGSGTKRSHRKFSHGKPGSMGGNKKTNPAGHKKRKERPMGYRSVTIHRRADTQKQKGQKKAEE